MERLDHIAARMKKASIGGRPVERSPNGITTIRRGTKPTEEAPVLEKSFYCPLCHDDGYIPSTIRIETEDGFSEQPARARCRCELGRQAPDHIPTHAQVFGRWPDEPQGQKTFGNQVFKDGEWVDE